MDFLLAAKYRYYGKDDSQNILQKVNREIPQNISACKHELLCIMNEVINLDPCCYWNRQVFNQTDSALQSIATQLPALSIDDTIFEFFLTGYNAYMQVTNVINDLSGLDDSPAIPYPYLCFHRRRMPYEFIPIYCTDYQSDYYQGLRFHI